jgi:hypothetical protein
MLQMQIGYKIATESFGPHEVIRQAVAAEEADFGHLVMQNAGPDLDGFMAFWRREQPIRKMVVRERG